MLHSRENFFFTQQAVSKYHYWEIGMGPRCTLCSIFGQLPRGGHIYFRLAIILVKGLSKHTLNTYFLGMKTDPKYAFLHAISSICPLCPFPKFVNMTKKKTLFSNFARFCTPKRCTRVHCLVLQSNPKCVFYFFILFYFIIMFFLRGWYPTSNTSASPRSFVRKHLHIDELKLQSKSVGLKLKLSLSTKMKLSKVANFETKVSSMGLFKLPEVCVL